MVHNLARAWRPKQFEEILGQQLLVRILKNSLYKSHFFPAYLFAGQRGCGKTSTARVFAAAVNCSRLALFQKNPKDNPLPCGTCPSCVAMRNGSHPDFFEIDAASNTGVEHIRTIIDSCALCSVMQGRKIYLIDEVHMLSKSAFNAFLKLLEEPPPSVLFILATTDPQKIPDTVKSRCFMLHFGAIDGSVVGDHLAQICRAEGLRYQDSALSLIARCCEGSMRDAVNLLERVRFVTTEITVSSVQSVLGHVDDETVVSLLNAVVTGNGSVILSKLKQAQQAGALAEQVWQRLKECVRAALWITHGVTPEDFFLFVTQLQRLADPVQHMRLVQLTESFCLHELAFQRSSDRYVLLEFLLLRICSAYSDTSGSNESPPGSTSLKQTKHHDACVEEEVLEEEAAKSKGEVTEQGGQRVLAVLQKIEDPLVQSVMMQVQRVMYEQAKCQLLLVFFKNRPFFSELLEQTRAIWEPIIQRLLGKNVALVWEFTAEDAVNDCKPASIPLAAKKERAVSTTPSRNSQKSVAPRSNDWAGRRRPTANRSGTIQQLYALRDITLKKLPEQALQQLPQLSALLRELPGIVYQMYEVRK